MTKYYSETRHYIRRSPYYPYFEDKEIRVDKHEISEKAYRIFTEEIYADCKCINNSDGSHTFFTILNANEANETTFWVEE